MDVIVGNTVLFNCIFLLIVIVVNLLLFLIKRILNANGYEMKYFYGHLNDLINFYDLIKNETDKFRKN